MRPEELLDHIEAILGYSISPEKRIDILESIIKYLTPHGTKD